MKKIKDIYESLSMKQKILVLVIICIILAVFNRLMSSDKDATNQYTSSINYKETSIEEILDDYYESYSNRNVYLELEYIIEKYCDIYTGDEKVYKDYYEIVDSNYSKYISKKNFMNKMNSIFSRLSESNFEYTIKLYNDEDNYTNYVVELCIEEETVGYIGFILESTYSIFYIE